MNAIHQVQEMLKNQSMMTLGRLLANCPKDDFGAVFSKQIILAMAEK